MTRTASILLRQDSSRLAPLLGLLSVLVLVLAYLLSSPDYHALDILNTTLPKTALVLTAHPDDEVMFFSPVILALIATGWHVKGLCLSIGDQAGPGDIRRKELFASYGTLGLDEKDVQVVDHPDLQDGMENDWDPVIIAKILQNYLEHDPVSLIVTFDHQGITRHPNHTPLPKSIPFLPEPLRPKVLALHSPSVLSKFTGLLLPIYYRVLARFPPLLGQNERVIVISSMKGYVQAVRGMMKHQSQLVWFRFLYLGFSRLMWLNELELV